MCNGGHEIPLLLNCEWSIIRKYIHSFIQFYGYRKSLIEVPYVNHFAARLIHRCLIFAQYEWKMLKFWYYNPHLQVIYPLYLQENIHMSMGIWCCTYLYISIYQSREIYVYEWKLCAYIFDVVFFVNIIVLPSVHQDILSSRFKIKHYIIYKGSKNCYAH